MSEEGISVPLQGARKCGGKKSTLKTLMKEVNI